MVSIYQHGERMPVEANLSVVRLSAIPCVYLCVCMFVCMCVCAYVCAQSPIIIRWHGDLLGCLKFSLPIIVLCGVSGQLVLLSLCHSQLVNERFIATGGGYKEVFISR